MRRVSILFYYLLSINAEKNNIDDPSVTFDQLFWLKALEIIAAKRLKIVPILDGFHMLMSFYGSIEHIPGGSGLEKVFQNAYGQNVLKHILRAKTIAREN